jgi:uncharacterized protein YecE (DUF72 family)
MARIWIGTSGWSYPGWNERFYPATLPRRLVLSYLASRFDSVELNGSFYSLQKPSSYRKWYAQTPPGFIFAIKGSRFITHNKKLADIDTALPNFFASGILLLKEKLGPIIWQLPANARFDPDRLAEFFARLPADTDAAARLARRHDARVSGRCWTRAPARPQRLRYGIEVRGGSFFVPALVRLARRHRIALVVSDAATWPRVEDVTADFVYIRLHGSQRTYASAYSDRDLDYWAQRITAWAAGEEPADAQRVAPIRPPRRRSRDVYVYFDNDYEANAPNDALRLVQRLPETVARNRREVLGERRADSDLARERAMNRALLSDIE